MERGTVPGADVFQNEDSALASLKARGLAKTVTRSRALLGYAVFGETALALVARRVRVAAVLPNGHEVLTVVEAKWHRAPLRDPKACLTKEERNRVASLTETPMENLYFYCETYDATRPFALAGDEDRRRREKNQTRLDQTKTATRSGCGTRGSASLCARSTSRMRAPRCCRGWRRAAG